MALLQRTRLLANERLDVPDFNRIEDFVCADFKAIHKKILANQNFVVQGFVASGVGTNTLSLVLADSAAIFGGDDGALFIGAPSLAPLATASLSPGVTNYVEIFVNQDTGGADSRAFWDPTAAGGAGAEFSQIVDTFTFLKANLSISTSNFSGASNKVKICEVDVNGSGVITAIRDRRDLYYRLGRGSNVLYAFPWSSRTEPANTSFTGADKDIKTQKNLNDAFADSIREIKGTTYWFEAPTVSIQGGFRAAALSLLTGSSVGARFSWTGTQLSITDDSVSPLDADVLAFLRLMDLTANLSLTRQDSANAIPISDGQVLWIEIPSPIVDATYDGVGSTASNYRVTNRGSVPLSQNTYWLAFREGTSLYVRGIGELEAGESSYVSDNLPQNMLDIIGLVDEHSMPTYTSNIRGSANQSIVGRVSALTDAVGDEQEDRSGYLRSDDPVTWDGTSLSFTSDIILEFVNTKSGTLTQHTIPMAASPINLANLESAYISINRSASSETCAVVLSGTTPIPAQSQANKDIFVIFRRVDATAGNFLHIPFHKQLIESGQTVRLGSSGSGTGGTPPLFEQETPAGIVNGINDTFTLSHSPKNSASVLVTIDWIKVPETQVTVTGTSVVFSGSSIPQLGQTVEVFYIADTTNTIVGVQEVPTGTINGINNTFTIAGSLSSASDAIILVDGVKILLSEWTLVGSNTIQFHVGSIPQVGQSLEIYYINNLDTTLVFQEVPTGTVDGINDTFALTNDPPYKNGAVVFVDGVKSPLPDWLLVHPGGIPSIRFVPGSLPQPGQSVEVFYFVVSGATSNTSLQDAYNNGNTIITTVGNPFTVSGAAAKVAQFNGDIGVTGVIDPKGITFIPQSSTPLQPTDYGLWVDNSGNLMQDRNGMPPVNLTAGASGSYQVNKITLSPTDISNGFVTLSGTPTTPSDTILDVIGGISQDYSVDFTVSGNQLSWTGLGLDGILSSGDKLIVQFN